MTSFKRLSPEVRLNV